MPRYTYVVESAVHGYHSEWDADQLHVAREIEHDLNEELFDLIVYRPLQAVEFAVSPAEESVLNAEYRRQMYTVTEEEVCEDEI